MIATGPDSYASTDEAGCPAPGLSRSHRKTWFEIEEKMFNSRRGFLAGAAATIGTMPLARPPAAQKSEVSSEAILAIFKSLPGDVAIKIYAPAANGKPEFLVESNASKTMFVGSAIKTYILCETLRQADSPNVVQSLKATQMPLDASVWSVDSAMFNPPNLIGKVSQRTALEAMILHSDNTATDMCIKHAGPDKVRALIASIGLKNTMVPDSTRALFGYLLGAKDPSTFSWEDIGTAANSPMVNSPMNKVETMTSTADDFISYYSRALHGEFFKNKETLYEFRRILSMSDAIWLLPLPLGVSAFCKGGSIDVAGFHALCVPGGMFFDGRWVYFCLTFNWYAKATSDQDTANAFVAAASRAMVMVKDSLSA
jgi:beta-lactamase class A